MTCVTLDGMLLGDQLVWLRHMVVVAGYVARNERRTQCEIEQPGDPSQS
jgi:hypothetical protein